MTAASGLTIEPSGSRKPVELSKTFQPPTRSAQSSNRITSLELREPVSLPVGGMVISCPSALSSSTALGLAAHTCSNCSGVSRRSAGNCNGAGDQANGSARVIALCRRLIQS